VRNYADSNPRSKKAQKKVSFDNKEAEEDSSCAVTSSSSSSDDDIDNTALVLSVIDYADAGTEQPGICAAIRGESPSPHSRAKQTERDAADAPVHSSSPAMPLNEQHAK
jgi:hypothetical protein